MLWDDDDCAAVVVEEVVAVRVLVVVVVGLDEDDACRFLLTMLDCNQFGFYFIFWSRGRRREVRRPKTAIGEKV